MRDLLSRSNTLQTRYLVDITGFCCTLGYAALAYLARQMGEPELLMFYGILVWTAAPVFCLFLYLVRRDEPLPIGRLFFWAIVFRLCGVLGGPFYEDDFYRYLWDGYRFWEAGTPYGATPEAFFLDPNVSEALQPALDQINNPDLPTIYGPTTQLLFLLGFLLKAGSVSILQVLLIVVDLATLYLLTRLTTTRNVMLYAWCPLVIKEVAFTAHPDGLGVCFVLAAIVLATKEREGLAAVCLGFAVGAKLFALVLVPFVLCRARPRHWVYFAATLGLLYAPFFLTGATDLSTVILFAREWEFNASLYALLSFVLPATVSKLLLGTVYCMFLLLYLSKYRKGNINIPRGDWIFGALFVVVPVFNAWYMLWLLPFAAIYPSRWAWAASVALLLSYVTGLHLGNYDMQAYAQPLWARLTEFGVISVALLWDVQKHHRKKLENPIG